MLNLFVWNAHKNAETNAVSTTNCIELVRWRNQFAVFFNGLRSTCFSLNKLYRFFVVIVSFCNSAWVNLRAFVVKHARVMFASARTVFCFQNLRHVLVCKFARVWICAIHSYANLREFEFAPSIRMQIRVSLNLRHPLVCKFARDWICAIYSYANRLSRAHFVNMNMMRCIKTCMESTTV